MNRKTDEQIEEMIETMRVDAKENGVTEMLIGRIGTLLWVLDREDEPAIVGLGDIQDLPKR